MIDIMIFTKEVIFTANKILYGIAIVAWLLVIFYFSAQNSSESTVQSKGFTFNIVKMVNSFANKINIIKEMPTDDKINDIVDMVNPPMRKFAHGTVYFILAILVLLLLGTNVDNFWRNVLIAILCCFLYALADEYHQTFVPGRSGEFVDALIDTMGATLGCAIYGIGAEIKKRNEK